MRVVRVVRMRTGVCVCSVIIFGYGRCGAWCVSMCCKVGVVWVVRVVRMQTVVCVCSVYGYGCADGACVAKSVSARMVRKKATRTMGRTVVREIVLT